MLPPPIDPALFDLYSDHLWVAHCSEGLVPKASAEAIRSLTSKELHPWEMDWCEDFIGLPEQARGWAATVIGAAASDITLTSNTSTGLECISMGLTWHPGDEVLVPLGEFPSNVWPWKALASRGVTFREVPLWDGHRAGACAWEGRAPAISDTPEQRIIEALGPQTRLLAVSWVRFQDGLKLDLRLLGEACRSRGIHFVVDGIQGAGTAIPDLSHADAFATGGHKGLLSPQGIGFLWTSSEFRSQLIPTGTWLSVEAGTDFTRASTDFNRQWLRDGRCLEPGGPALLMCAAFAQSLQLIGQTGVSRIDRHVQDLQATVLEGLASVPAWKSEALRVRELQQQSRLGPTICLHHHGTGSQAMMDLLAIGFGQGIHASVREGYLRLALHGYHTEADAMRLVGWLGNAGL